MSTDPKRRARTLREQLLRASEEYYNDAEPSLSDAEYDALFVELRELEEAHPELVDAASPTQRVGAPLPKGSQLTPADHLAPMLSIESLTSNDAVVEFVDRARKGLELEEGDELQWILEPKFDGVSASLLYEDGELVRALSRGDGATGENITHNLKALRDVPLRLEGDAPIPSRIEIRGEVIIARETFKALQSRSVTSGGTTFRNARNTAAGTLKQLDPGIAARRGLEFLCWGIGHAEGIEAETYATLREQLVELGVRFGEPSAAAANAEEIIAYHDDLQARRDELPFEMDGIVAKVDRLDLQRRLGRTSRTPRWMLAHKFASQVATTKVLDVITQVGRTGRVTPVADLEPVELAGVTVRRATLHNWGLLAERDVRVGDVVDVERAGDVIPAVTRVHTEKREKSSKPVERPSECPVCSTPLEEDGAFLDCPNMSCPAALRGRIVHLSGRRGLDIERLGAKNADQLISAGLIQTMEDVFTLDQKSEEILALERWGERSFEILTRELDEARKPSLPRFLYSLGIRHVGERTAKDLAEQFETMDALRSATEEQLVEVDGVGPEVAASLHRFFELPTTERFFEAIAEAGVEIQAEERQEGGEFEGRVFCFTGGLDQMSRDEAKAIVEGRGAKTSASVTKKVTDVVAGAKAGSKLEKAKKLELNILTEEEFLELIGRA